MTSRRLDHGGRIDRAVKLPFAWNGEKLHGCAGDTVASALLANGVQLVGRSFKYHRPRGVQSAGVDESGALVTVGVGARRDPNVKATVQELYAGLNAASQNAWPSVKFDVGALANLFGRFLPAGFYYKTFMGPRIVGGTKLWMQFEKIIRRAAGMGEASRAPDPDAYEHGNAFCDVLVVGGGPTGLSAAATAARAGLDVLLVEQDFALGGDLLNRPGDDRRIQLIKAAADAGVRVMTRTTAFGVYDHGVAGLLERVTDHLAAADPAPVSGHGAGSALPRQRFWTARARHIVIAAGAMERGVAFGDNDRPGVMSASAARAYLNRFGVLAGARVVVATNNDSAYPAARELSAAGAAVTVLDARATVDGDGANGDDDGDDAGANGDSRGVTVHHGYAPLRVVGGAGGVRALDVATAAANGWRHHHRERCDLVLVSGGWSPTIHLHSMRARPVWNADLQCFLAGDTDEPLTVAGAAAGVWRTDGCVASGNAAGVTAASACGVVTGNTADIDADTGTVTVANGWQTPIQPLYEVRVKKIRSKSFVDMQNDVTADDIRLAHREGFVAGEHLKRYTTLGMATDGGKVGNVIGLALMAAARGCAIDEVGVTAFRPPFTPVALGALRGRSVGEHFRPLRRTPMHDWNLKHGATMTMAGLWHRPWFFARDGEGLQQSYIREAATVRDTVGLCDVTSLGKIAVQGPDAAEFLNRVYTNAFAKLAVGKARYGIMLRDDGLVMDDGTTWRLAEADFFMTTTTAHAGKVMAWLEELLQTRWCELKVAVTSVTDQWAGCAVAGPRAREVLQTCVTDAAAVSNDALPFMGVAEITVADIPCRIARISFSGELAYEVYAPSDYATALMDALWSATQKFDGCLYGLESLGALRIEKGHVTGAELDGRVTLDDAGLAQMASTKKSFVGDALRRRPELSRDDRPRLVGIVPVNRADTFNAGAILCAANKVSGHGDGWVTAVTHSPALGHWIGIGFISGGVEAWRDRAVTAADPVRKGDTDVEIVSAHFVDPGGERMRG